MAGGHQLDIYDKAYGYYTWSRGLNGKPPMMDFSRYMNMVPYHEAVEIAGYYDNEVANGNIKDGRVSKPHIKGESP